VSQSQECNEYFRNDAPVGTPFKLTQLKRKTSSLYHSNDLNAADGEHDNNSLNGRRRFDDIFSNREDARVNELPLSTPNSKYKIGDEDVAIEKSEPMLSYNRSDRNKSWSDDSDTENDINVDTKVKEAIQLLYLSFSHLSLVLILQFKGQLC
jgi:hypothetical protein